MYPLRTNDAGGDKGAGFAFRTVGVLGTLSIVLSFDRHAENNRAAGGCTDHETGRPVTGCVRGGENGDGGGDYFRRFTAEKTHRFRHRPANGRPGTG